MTPYSLSRRTFLGGTFAIPFMTPAVAAQSPGPLRIVMTGQALLQHDLSAAQWPAAAKFAALFAGADMVFTDLETAIKGPRSTTAMRNDQFLHAAGPEIIDVLTRAGFDTFATSNNHAYDFAEGGILDAIAALDERGLTHAGTGPDLASAAAPALRQTSHGTAALVSAAAGAVAKGGMAGPNHPGVNELRRAESDTLNEEDVGRYLDVIKNAAQNADVVIAYLHQHYWEKNMADTPPWQKALAHRVIDAGATIFVSHGPPLLHGVEIYKGKAILYDLGGFFFQTITKPGHYPNEVWQSVVVDCRCTKAGIASMSFTPVQMNDTGLAGVSDMETRGMPDIATGDAGAKILDRLARISAPYGTKMRIGNGRAELVLS
ncbi:MAG: CapA family protein [Proteobacteria bacterium]|nr:CapA family protein [Pseudomonadota bacterium]